VGEDRGWGAVLVAPRPGEDRPGAVERLARRAEAVVVHDTQQVPASVDT
jgi:hypothetical protein